MRENLEASAKEALEKKDGLNTQIKLTKDSDEAILDLNNEQSTEFISKVFASSSKDGYVLLEDRAVVYEIVEQSLLNENKQFASLIASNAAAIKTAQLEQGLIDTVQKRYVIKKYYK